MHQIIDKILPRKGAPCTFFHKREMKLTTLEVMGTY